MSEPCPAQVVEEGSISLDQALEKRRSVRELAKRVLTQEEISRLLFAAQGQTDPRGRRTAPSAGATYPLELHLLTAEGVFRYDPPTGKTEPLSDRDSRAALVDAALGQRVIGEAPAVFVIAGVHSRTEWKYKSRAGRYVAMEAGAASENLLLMATSLGLGAVLIGAFDDDQVRDVALLPDDAVPLAIIPVGEPRR